MVRPLLVLILAAAIFGSLAGYSQFLATLSRGERARAEPRAADGAFRLEATLSFDAAPDAFTFPGDPSLVVRLAGRDLMFRADRVDSRETLRAEGLSGIVAGKNAFFVRAIPAAEFVGRANALQLRILRNEQVVAEQTLWSTPGDIVAGEIRLDLANATPPIAEGMP